MDLHQLFWLLKLGRPKRRATIYDIRDNVGNYIKEPVFFLSTGRCGTKWFSDLLSQDRQLAIFHQPIPSFASQSRVLYELSVSRDVNQKDNCNDCIKEIFWAGREEYIRYTYKTSKRYVETNNSITFLASALVDLFPDAKFVHLVRHPGEFIRSGMSRNYYNGDVFDLMKIVPLKEPYRSKWFEMSQLEKIAWLWNETNLFIEDALKGVNENQFVRFNFNDLSVSLVEDLIAFLNIDIPTKTLQRAIGKPKNIQQKHSVSSFQEWKKEDIDSVRKITGDLASRYGYAFS